MVLRLLELFLFSPIKEGSKKMKRKMSSSFVAFLEETIDGNPLHIMRGFDGVAPIGTLSFFTDKRGFKENEEENVVVFCGIFGRNN